MTLARVVVSAVLTAHAAVAGGAQAARPSPVPDELYRAVRDNLTRAERAAPLYTFKERRTDVHTNPFGRIGTGGTRLFEVYPSTVRRLTYRRLVAQEGEQLSEAALAEQDREYRRRVAEVQRELAEMTVEERTRQDADTARARERRTRRIEDVLNTLEFALEGRTVYQGVPAIVVSFEPRPGARPETREGKIAQAFRGSVWIHEAASEVMRVEAESVESITFGFGIVARVGKGATATLTRRPVEGGVWMPSEITLDGRGRAILFRSLVLDFSLEWFDYRRLSGDSLAPFLDLVPR